MRSTVRSDILLLRGSHLIELVDRPGRWVNRKRHALLTMIRLSTVKPQRLIRLHLKSRSLERYETSCILGNCARLEASEDSIVDRLTWFIEGGLYESMICCEELELDVVADCSGDKRWSVFEAVFADFDDMGYWGAMRVTLDFGGFDWRSRDGGQSGQE